MAYLRRLEFASVELSLKNLMTFPCVRILVERGKLALHGAYFGVASGVLWCATPIRPLRACRPGGGDARDDDPLQLPLDAPFVTAMRRAQVVHVFVWSVFTGVGA